MSRAQKRISSKELCNSRETAEDAAWGSLNLNCQAMVLGAQWCESNEYFCD